MGEQPDETATPPRTYGGIDRINYLLANVLIDGVGFAVAYQFQTNDLMVTVTSIIAGVLFLVATAARLPNLGYEVTALNLFNPVMIIRCYLAPTGYADNRRLDVGGALLILLVVVAVIFGVLFALGGLPIELPSSV